MTSPDTSPASSASLAQTLARCRKTERSCLDALEKLSPGGAVEADLRLQLGRLQRSIEALEAEYRKALVVELERDNPWMVALEKQRVEQEQRDARAARKAALQTFAGDRADDEPKFIGFDEPAIAPVGGE